LIHLDCTLRDGGYQNGWNFSAQFVNDFLNLTNMLKLDVVELGIKSNIKNDNFGPLSHCNDCDIELLPNSRAPYSVLVNISEFIDQDIKYFKKLFPVSSEKSRYKIVRMAGTSDTIQRCEPHVEYLKTQGYTVCLNVMRVSTIDGLQLSALGEAIKNVKYDVLYLADSFGNLTPKTTLEKIKALTSVGTKTIGVHMHDNLGLALQNTVTATKCGASWFDTTFMGMGRGAGNAATEKLFLSQRNTAHLHAQVEFIIKHIQPIFNDSPWGPSLDFYYAGLWNIHPNYVSKMRDYKLNIADILAVLLSMQDTGNAKFDLKILEAAMEALS